jgi:hypothetical protein
VFAIISTRGNPTVILEQANSISATVKLTLEREKKGCLPFLDVKIVKEGNKLNTYVYRKATDSGRYLNFKSNHPTSVKVGVVSCLLLRAETHCSKEKTNSKELKHIKITIKKTIATPQVCSEKLKERKWTKNWREQGV